MHRLGRSWAGRLIAVAKAELEAAEGTPLKGVRIRVRPVGGNFEMHISASAKYGVPCPDVVADLRKRILGKTSGKLAAVHFFVKKLLIGHN